MREAEPAPLTTKRCRPVTVTLMKCGCEVIVVTAGSHKRLTAVSLNSIQSHYSILPLPVV